MWVKVKRKVTADGKLSEQVGGGESETPVKDWLWVEGAPPLL